MTMGIEDIKNICHQQTDIGTFIPKKLIYIQYTSLHVHCIFNRNNYNVYIQYTCTNGFEYHFLTNPSFLVGEISALNFHIPSRDITVLDSEGLG